MLLHFVPRLFASRVNEPECTLVDFQCPLLDLQLIGGIDLVARRPYPNKNYLVACRKIGQKAMNGFFVETTQNIREFKTITRWAVDADRIVSHVVQYFVLDAELDAITDDMALWHATSPCSGGFKRRWPSVANGWYPADAQPRMELIKRDRVGNYTDSFDENGCIIERTEVFQLHTVERKRIFFQNNLDFHYSRMPNAETAFSLPI